MEKICAKRGADGHERIGKRKHGAAGIINWLLVSKKGAKNVPSKGKAVIITIYRKKIDEDP
jgi:hypothetical protein